MGNKQNAPVTTTKAPEASKVSSEISSYHPPQDHEDISNSELSELNLESRQQFKEEQLPTEEVYSIKE